LNKLQAVLFFILVASTLLVLIPKAYGVYSFTFRGAYYDDGTFAGAVNCTLWREGEAPVRFTLDGEYVVGAEQLPAVLTIHLPYNESRTIYLLEAGTYYVFIPQAGNLYTYYFQIVDFVGVSRTGYIESWLNVNGTLRLVERQPLSIINDIPFKMSWSYAYNIAIFHSDYGRGWVGTYVAGSKTTYLIHITRDIFPQEAPSTSAITRSCIRHNATWVQFYYSDTKDQTNWVQFSIYKVGSTTPVVEYNSTSEPISWNYYDLNPSESYIGRIQISHDVLGDYQWSWVLPSTRTVGENPFAFLDTFGESFPFPLRYLPATIMVLMVFMAFSWWNLPIGIVVGYLFAAFFSFLGWLPIGFEWLWVSGCISFIIAIGLAKERESAVY